MQRVMVLGSSGSGKSTLARRLGERFGLPVTHLDTVFWKPGWVESLPAEFDARVLALAAQPRWVIDGNYSRTLDARLAVADTVIFLDMPRRLCMWRIFKRRWQYAGRTRPDMNEGCPEKVDWPFVKWVWNYPQRTRPRTLAKLAALPGTTRVVHLRSPREVRAFLAQCGA